jgi:hypothetical protein
MTRAILSQIEDTLLGVRGAAAQLGQITVQIQELAVAPVADASDCRVRSRTIQAQTHRVALAASSLAAHAGRLEAFAAVLAIESDARTRRTIVARDVVTAQALRDAELYVEDERDHPGTCPTVDDWARDAFDESWKDWQHSLGMLSNDARRIYLEAFVAAVRGAS